MISSRLSPTVQSHDNLSPNQNNSSRFKPVVIDSAKPVAQPALRSIESIASRLTTLRTLAPSTTWGPYHPPSHAHR